MSRLKTKIDSDSVFDFLNQNFDSEVSGFTKITGGELSQAFSFAVDEEKYVIRINSDNQGFEKDKYAFDNFASADIPIPKTIKIGTFSETFYYSITEKASGKILDELEESETLVKSVISTLDAIHDTPITGEKYGHWDATGEAGHDTWQGHLLELLEYNRRDIEAKNHADFLDEQTIDNLTKTFVSLVPCCPEVRHLLHADFESSNTLSDGEKITGVIDWANSKYGDPVFDIAWIDFWKEKIDYKGIFEQHILEKGDDLEKYKERVLCYMLYFGIGALFFFAKSHQKGSYEWTQQRLLKVVAGT